MAIYTAFGERVQITGAMLVPCWTERRSGEIKLHYREPKPTKKTKSIEANVDMLVKGFGVDDSGSAVRKLCDGKFMQLSRFKADDGWKELCTEFWRVSGQEADWHRWNKSDGPKAEEIFPLVEETDVA